jgi:hypothetical protein
VNPRDQVRIALTVLAVAFSLALYAIYFYEPPDPKVVLAQQTVRVDYDDGVSCYHRGDAISCVYVPTRSPLGPEKPAAWPAPF